MTNQEFHDERINAECGRIYQWGIFYASLVALVYGILHYMQLDGIISAFYDKARTLTNFYIFLLPEATVFFSGLIILLIGQALHGRTRDERELFEQHDFYLSAGKVFVTMAFIGYAVTIPFSTAQWANDMPLNYLVQFFSMLGVIYLYYNFKKQDIFFNYTFIHERRGIYYKRVFLNIAKLAWFLFPGFFGSGLIDLGLHGSLLHFSAILYAYVVSVLGLGLEYLFISWTEKLSYDEGEAQGLHKGTFVLFIFLLGTSLLSFFPMLLQLFVSYSADVGEQLIDQGYALGEVLASISQVRNAITHEVAVLTAMVLCKLMRQIKACGLARKAIAGLLILTSVSIVMEYISTFALALIDHTELEVIMTYVRINSLINLLLLLLHAVLWLIMVYDLVKVMRMSPALWAVPMAKGINFLLSCLVSIVSHQGLNIFTAIANSLLSFGALLLLLIVLFRHRYPQDAEKTSENPII